MGNMKWIVVVLALQGLALAQDKINVPLSKPGQPVTLDLRLGNTSVTINAGTGNDVTLEIGSSKRTVKRKSQVPPGMKRIDINPLGFEVDEKDNTITLRDRGNTDGPLVITVPVKTSIIAKTTNCRFAASGLEGNVEIENANGSINITKLAGAAVIHNRNGSITAELIRVAPDQAMSFTAVNGRVDVTLPAATKAKLKLRAEHGAVYSDFPMAMEAGGKAEASDGRYQVKMDRSVTATINGGGPEYLFQSMNGSILIHKK